MENDSNGMGLGISFWGDECILELESSDGCATL